MIQVVGLCCRFGDRTVINDLDAHFADASVNYLVGLNGAGKTTLLSCLAGFLVPSAGEICIDGMRREDLKSTLNHVGFHVSIDNLHEYHTGRGHLRWLAALTQMPSERADFLIDFVGLGQAQHTRIKHYSLGMKQRLGIAAALMGDPQNIILDEPMNGLDFAGRLWLLEVIQELRAAGKCVLVTSHHSAEIATADSVQVIAGGKFIFQGSVAELLSGADATDPQSIEQALRGLLLADEQAAAGTPTCPAPGEESCAH